MFEYHGWATIRDSQDAFGGNLQFVGLENFQRLFSDPLYLNSMRVTAVFSVSVTVLGLGFSLLLAWFADRALKARLVFRTLLEMSRTLPGPTC